MVRQGTTEEAMPHLLHIASLDPDDIPAIVNIGAYYAAQGRVDDATQEFETVVRLTDHSELSTTDRRYRSSALLNLGFAYTQSTDYPKALVSFKRANQFEPAMVDQTIETVEHSLAGTPSESSYLKLSLLLRAKGKDSDASSILESAIQANPEYLRTRELLSYLNAIQK